MTVFFLFLILITTLAIIKLIHYKQWFFQNRLLFLIVVGLYILLSCIRFIFLDPYIDVSEYMLFFLFSIIVIELLYDLSLHKIAIWPIIIVIPLLVVYRVLSYQTITLYDMVAVTLTGVCVWSVKNFLNHIIGYGDILICGLFICWLGWQIGIFLILTGFVINGIICVILFALKRVNRKSQIPFMPAMTIGLTIYLIGGVFL